MQALKSKSITVQSEIKIGGILSYDNNVGDYEPYVPVQRVVELRDGMIIGRSSLLFLSASVLGFAVAFN